jgi:hypothetical protein
VQRAVSARTASVQRDRRVGAMSMKSKIAFEKKGEKQRAAIKRLEEARALGLEPLVEAVVNGNRFVIDVVAGRLLAPGVEKFKVTDDEAKVISAVIERIQLRERAEKTAVEADDLWRRQAEHLARRARNYDLQDLAELGVLGAALFGRTG